MLAWKRRQQKCYYGASTLFRAAPPGVGWVTILHGESAQFTSPAQHPGPYPSESHEVAILGSPTPRQAKSACSGHDLLVSSGVLAVGAPGIQPLPELAGSSHLLGQLKS